MQEVKETSNEAETKWPQTAELVRENDTAREQYRNIRELNASHLAMLELVLDGLTQRQIAEKLGTNSTTVGMLLGSPLAQAELSRRRAERQHVSDQVQGVRKANAMRTLEENLERAANAQVDLLAEEDPRVRQKAIDSIFDRCFGKGSDVGLERLQETDKGVMLNNITVNIINDTLKEVKELIQVEQSVPTPVPAALDARSNVLVPAFAKPASATI